MKRIQCGQEPARYYTQKMCSQYDVANTLR